MAVHNLILVYIIMPEIESDEQRALELYQKVAKQGYGSAQYVLGIHYAVGIGVEKDAERVDELYHVESIFRFN